MNIETNIPLKDKTWFQTGGPARYFCEPTTSQEFQQALQYAHDNNLEIFILGVGANILVSDDGFDGLVIRPQLKDVTITKSGDDILVKADAGVIMADLINYCFDNNILGLEEFSGIPSTIGGAAYINLHYFKCLFSQLLVEAIVIEKETGKLMTVNTDWFEYGYNKSKLLEGNHYLVSATIKLKKASDLEVAYTRGKSDEIIRYRTYRYPSKNTCGSFFRNFHEHEVTEISNGKKMIHVAYYLDKLGIKGCLSQGDACVSHQHANMLVNRGQATTNDIIKLSRLMQEKVKEKFDIIPQPECQFIGFKEYPLL
ncbi:UDP-N-acetylenolpyruvoylglucosamine reductase [candidate division TM6 bacterium RIFCSPHIGHO2_12_FULL_36_22]|nr:MAG: UDP-N-acetylenolpyruvoylglucosamine reductase [candidate division TM6 bacterium RIFCSPHIGHO2_12_FULL_36_22]